MARANARSWRAEWRSRLLWPAEAALKRRAGALCVILVMRARSARHRHRHCHDRANVQTRRWISVGRVCGMGERHSCRSGRPGCVCSAYAVRTWAEGVAGMSLSHAIHTPHVVLAVAFSCACPVSLGRGAFGKSSVRWQATDVAPGGAAAVSSSPSHPALGRGVRSVHGIPESKTRKTKKAALRRPVRGMGTQRAYHLPVDLM